MRGELSESLAGDGGNASATIKEFITSPFRRARTLMSKDDETQKGERLSLRSPLLRHTFFVAGSLSAQDLAYCVGSFLHCPVSCTLATKPEGPPSFLTLISSVCTPGVAIVALKGTGATGALKQ